MEVYYNSESVIRLDEVPEIGSSTMYIAVDTKELTDALDLRKEVVMTMLNQLE